MLAGWCCGQVLFRNVFVFLPLLGFPHIIFPIWHTETGRSLLARHRDDAASLVHWSWQACGALRSPVVSSSFFFWSILIKGSVLTSFHRSSPWSGNYLCNCGQVKHIVNMSYLRHLLKALRKEHVESYSVNNCKQVQQCRELSPVLQSAGLCACSVRPAKNHLFFPFPALWTIHSHCTCLRNAS